MATNNQRCAQVFRAAADGIAGDLAPYYRQYKDNPEHAHLKRYNNERNYVIAQLKCPGNGENDVSIAMYTAYDGVASLYEKLAETDDGGRILIAVEEEYDD